MMHSSLLAFCFMLFIELALIKALLCSCIQQFHNECARIIRFTVAVLPTNAYQFFLDLEMAMQKS